MELHDYLKEGGAVKNQITERVNFQRVIISDKGLMNSSLSELEGMQRLLRGLLNYYDKDYDKPTDAVLVSRVLPDLYLKVDAVILNKLNDMIDDVSHDFEVMT